MLKKLSLIPRETRDTLFLLALVVWLILPHLNHLPLSTSVLAFCLIGWRFTLAVTGRALPGRWDMFLAVSAAAAVTYWNHRTFLGRDVGINLIVLGLALKMLELRTHRDTFVLFFLGFFTLLTHFFFSQSLLTALAMLIGVLGLLTMLVNSHMPAGRPALGQAARIGATLALLGAPIMVLLFLLFPRLAPLWATPGDAMAGRSGLSERMTVGNIAQLALDDSVAMRLRFEGTPPKQSELYFRGPVLSRFDGREWLPARAQFSSPVPPQTTIEVSGPAIKYEVTLEPSNRPWVLTLDMAPDRPSWPGTAAQMTDDLQWLASEPINDLVRYRAISYPQFRHGPLRANAQVRNNTLLPVGSNPRTVQLAADIRRDAPSADTPALVAHVLERLRTGGYSYTLEPGVFGQHTADEFWFDRREGFCEHIASSFVILMRALNVPARIVTGYQGASRNAFDDFWVVRQSDAHAWAEVWIAGQGWQRVDPTGAVSPGRVGTLTRLQVPSGAIASALSNITPGLAIQVRALWEAVNNGWNQRILNYTQSKQLNLLRNLGFSSPSWEDLGLVLLACIVLAAVVGALWTLWDRHQRDPWLRLLDAARRRVSALGVAATGATPPRELAQRVLQQRGATDRLALALSDWLHRLEALRYANTTTNSATPALRSALRRLRSELKQLKWNT